MRLIDADALEEEINLYHSGLKPRYISKLVDAEIDDILDIIGEAPMIFGVQVVRCKDCKHCGKFRNWNGREYFGCNVNAADIYEIDPMHFCSYGERKGGGEDEV